MKKVLAGIAVLAVAASAQAGLLATWQISSGTQTVNPGDAENADKITFSTLTASEGVGYGSANGAVFRSNNWAQEGTVKDGHYIETTFDLEDNYKFTLESINVPFSLGNPGAAHFIWKDQDGTPVTASAGPTASGTSAPISFAAVGTPTWTSDGALRMYAADGLTVGGGNASSGSRTDIRSGMTVYGTVALNDQPSGVPEPATMSLLGLGALAIALRRKLRK